MEERRFDDLTRALGQATSRRQVLKGVIGTIVGGAAAGVGFGRSRGALAAEDTLCGGVPYDPGYQCCEPDGVQQRYPITDLDACPNRVPHPGATPGFNGCGPENGFIKYLIPNRIGPWRNIDFTLACNGHDICYSTCNSEKSSCDRNFFIGMVKACAAEYPKDTWYDRYMLFNCSLVARMYYTAVSATSVGREAYADAQKVACDCCPTCQDCNGPNDQCCDQRCTDVSSDDANCGACGNACRSDQVCLDSACQCPTGQTECSGVCVDLNSDPANCGACGNVCPAGSTCVEGSCTCPPGTALCGDECVNLAVDPNHCGNCDTVCSACEECIDFECKPKDCGNPCLTCQDGECVSTCGAGMQCCSDGTCKEQCLDCPPERLCADTCCPEGDVCSEGTTCVPSQCATCAADEICCNEVGVDPANGGDGLTWKCRKTSEYKICPVTPSDGNHHLGGIRDAWICCPVDAECCGGTGYLYAVCGGANGLCCPGGTSQCGTSLCCDFGWDDPSHFCGYDENYNPVCR